MRTFQTILNVTRFPKPNFRVSCLAQGWLFSDSVPGRLFSDKKCSGDSLLEKKDRGECKKGPSKGKEDGAIKVLPIKFPLEPVPSVDRTLGKDECLRPYVNPCPPYAPCDPRFLPVHPCREKTIRPPFEDIPVREELSPGTRKVLLILSSLIGGALLYRAFTMPKEEPLGHNVRPRCILRPQFIERTPKEAVAIPTETKYLIVGGGTAAFSAFRTIKNLDPSAKIMVIAEEPYAPYMRAPLSKDLLFSEDRKLSQSLRFKSKKQVKGKNQPDESIFYEPDEFFTPVIKWDEVTEGITVIRGYKVQKIDHEKKKAKIEGGPSISYEKCLLATGAKTKCLQVFDFNTDDVKERATNYRTVYDYMEVEDVIRCGAKTIAILGGNSTACELACALLKRGINVLQIIEGDTVMNDVLPCYLSKELTKKLEKAGVKIMKNTHIEDALVSKKKLKLISKARKCITVDHAIVSSGTEPNTELAKPSGIETDEKRGGFLVNTEFQVRTDLYAAGDCASFYHPLLGRRRLESHDHAMVTGRIAGENMVGEAKSLDKETAFYTELSPLAEVETVGVVDPKLPTVGVFLDKQLTPKQEKDNDTRKVRYDSDSDYNRGVIFYLDQKKVVGILLWNLVGRTFLAQALLGYEIAYDQIDEASKLFRMHVM